MPRFSSLAKKCSFLFAEADRRSRTKAARLTNESRAHLDEKGQHRAINYIFMKVYIIVFGSYTCTWHRGRVHRHSVPCAHQRTIRSVRLQWKMQPEFTYAARDVQPFAFVLGLLFTFFSILFSKRFSRNVVVVVVSW